MQIQHVSYISPKENIYPATKISSLFIILIQTLGIIMESTNQSWSICVLCYNEEGSISKVLTDLEAVFTEKPSIDYEIIVINDGSTDGSREVIQDHINRSSSKKLKLIDHPENLGIGMAIRTGYQNSEKENVMAMCGDGQFKLEDLKNNLSIENGSFISYFRKDKTNYTLFRKFLSETNKSVNRYFFGIHLKDVNWVKAYKREDLESIDYEIQSSLVETEIAAKLIKKGLHVKEVETYYLPRLAGEAKGASLKIVYLAVIELFKLIYVINVKFRPS